MATTKATLLGHRSATSFSDLTLSGDLTVNGTTTTLDTAVQNVDKLEIGASSTDYGAKINQASTGNILQLQDNGTDVMVVEDGGNVGIGVSDPDVEVEIKKSSANATLAINAGSANDAQLQLRTGDANDYTIYVDGSETNDPLHFWDHASGTAPLTLMNGNVGIRNTPSYRLDITGPGTSDGSTLRLNDSASSANSKHLLITRGGSTASIGIAGSQVGDPFWISRSGGYDFVISSDGDVGIGGTASSNSKLKIKESSSSLQNVGDENTLLQLGSDSYNNTYGGQFEFRERRFSSAVSNGHALAIYGKQNANANASADSFLMTIQSNGNIGIATSSPNSNGLLHIVGNSAPSNSMGGKGLMLTHSNGNSAPIYFGDETGSSAKAIYMRSYYMTIRGHDNEGVKFDGSGSSVTRYRFNMGNNGNTCFNASNSSSWNTTSDSRIKENVQSLPDGAIEKIKALRPVTFDYTDDWATQKGWFNYTASEDDPHELTENGFNLEQKNNDIGWIAQEYEAVFPEDVRDSTETVNGSEVNDFKTLKPDSLLPYIVKAIQELSAKVTTLENATN